MKKAIRQAAFLGIAASLAAASSAEEAWQTECVGYHAIDLPAPVEAATEEPTSDRYSQIGGGGFTEVLATMNGGNDSGELTVEVSDPTTRERFDGVIYRKRSISTIDGRELEPYGIQYARSEIEGHKEIIAKQSAPPDTQASIDWVKGRLAKGDITPEIAEGQIEGYKARDAEWHESKKNGELEKGLQSFRRTIARYEREIAAWEASAETWLDKDTYYYDGWLWLWRSPRIYRLRLESLPEGMAWDEATLALASRFRVRKAGEMPAEAGFCVPYGFIRGVSPLAYDIQATYRSKAEPGLLYTVRLRADPQSGARHTWLPGAPKAGGGPFREVRDKVAFLGKEALLVGWHGKPYAEERLPDGGWLVTRKAGGREDPFKRREPQGETFALQAFAVGKDALVPEAGVQAVGYGFAADPSLKGRAIPSLESKLPEIRRVMGSLRLRPENEKALRAALKEKAEKDAAAKEAAKEAKEAAEAEKSLFGRLRRRIGGLF